MGSWRLEELEWLIGILGGPKGLDLGVLFTRKSLMELELTPMVLGVLEDLEGPWGI